MTSISLLVIKRLYANSRNKCAFPDCPRFLVDKDGTHIGEIAHIEAEKPGGPRYNPNQTPQERFGYDNLILLCPNHHSLIDKYPSKFTVEVLKKMKGNHESENRDINLLVSYLTESRTSEKHNYKLRVTIENNSGLTIKRPKLEIILPEQVTGVTSTRAKKTVEGKLVHIYFDELDVSEIHPGENKILMETPNVGIYYFMNSDLYDDSLVMTSDITVKLFADSIRPIVVTKKFKEMQEF